jgi:hypothetical protein
MDEDVIFGTWNGAIAPLKAAGVTEDNLALDVRGPPGKTAVRMALT